MSELDNIKQRLEQVIAETNDYRALTALSHIELLEEMNEARKKPLKHSGLLKDCKKVLTNLGFSDII